jgi:glycosyltransferase involved in cell wall biosynthesis
MKLIIQIPCFNEAETLPQTIADLPREISGVDEVEIMIIDDGSTDRTADIAEELGVDYIVRLPRNRGLAHAFAQGLLASLERGADIIVNTDGDNQYPGRYVDDLVQPILSGDADMVVGDRQIDRIEHFTWFKKQLQKFGSWVVRWASKTNVPDATSGFRAFSRDAAMHLVIFSSYTYTLETIIQAGRKGLTVTSIPITTNERLRDSRLIRSQWDYVSRSATTIIRIFLMYDSLRVFFILGLIPLFVGIFLLIRFGYFYISGDGTGHVQSLIVASIAILLSFQTFLLGLLADLIAKNRHLNEEINYRLKKLEADRLPK